LASPNGIGEHYNTRYGLQPPPDSFSYFSWVDPSFYKIPKREFLLTKESIDYKASILKYNFKILIYCFTYFSYLKIGLFFLIAATLFIDNKATRDRLLLFHFTALLIMTGYGLILVEERYFIGVHFLFFMATFISTIQLSNQFKINTFFKTSIVVLIFISFSKIAYLGFQNWGDSSKKTLSEKITKHENKIANLSFLKNCTIAKSINYNELEDLSYYSIFKKNNCINYGSVCKNDTESNQYNDLKKHQIDFLFFSGCSKVDKTSNCTSTTTPYYLKNKKPLFIDSEFGVSIYAMKPYQ
jgi:hypothetical protein